MSIPLLRRGGLIAGILLLAAPALAEPYFTVREGLPCSACHVNMNGGGMRTDLVATHARDLLHYQNFFGKFSTAPDFFSGEINKYVSMGSDLRVTETAVFQDLGSHDNCPDYIRAASPTARCVDNDKVFRGRLETNSIDVTEANLYGQVKLIPDYLSFYIDQQFQPTTNNREAFGLLHGIFPWNGYFKAGRMFLPYGLQLQQDQAFIRGGRTNGSSSIGTGFSFNFQEPAFEIGFEPEPFTMVVAVSNGGTNRDVRVTGTATALFTELPVVRNVFLGSSFSRVGVTGGESVLFGFFAGSNIERLTVLGEVDFLSDSNSTTNGRSIGRFIGYGEGDYLLFGWMNVKVNGEYSDNDGTLGDTSDSENAVSFGVEPFLNRFLQPRIFYQINNGITSNATHNQNVLQAEVHVFF